MQVGFFSLLFLLFLGLKLGGLIAWSWLWVTAPIWMPIIFGIIFLIFLVIFVVANEVSLNNVK